MKILFDLQGIQNPSRDRGIGRYVLNLFKAIATRRDVEVYALLNGALADTIDSARTIATEIVGENNILVFPGLAETMPHNPYQKSRQKLCEAAYEAFVQEANCDVLLVGSLFEGFNDETVVSLKKGNAKYTTAVILYDLIPLINPEKYIGLDLAHSWYFDRIEHVKIADILCAISESSRQEAIKYLEISEGRVVNVGTAVNPDMFCIGEPATSEQLHHLGITKPFIMHASAVDERKNFHGLIDAFARLDAGLRKHYQLVLVGGASPQAAAMLRDRATAHGLDELDVVLTGYIPDPQLAALYRSCELFVFPSFHEGFGLPVLEAMSCGCPAIGSNVTSIPEVIGRDDLTFDPESTDSIARAIQRVLSDTEQHADAVRHALAHAKTFSWDIVADRVVSALKAQSHNDGERPVRYPSLERMVETVSARYDVARFGKAEIEELSSTLVSCEKALIRQADRAVERSGQIWRVEGPFDSSYSLALLNRETARALDYRGYRVALHSTEGPGDFEPSELFLEKNPDLKKMNEFARQTCLKDAFVASRNLYPPRVADMDSSINALHHFAWEESGFPQDWANNFNNSLQMMTCLSEHVKKIMIDNGVAVPMITSGCGVDHWQRISSDSSFRVAARSFKFLHVSSCFPRKGVDILLEAFESSFTIDDDVSLIIKTFQNPHNDILEKLQNALARNPRFPHVIPIFADLSEGELKALYQQCDVMVCPSFAEGYGVPLAEAFLSGIPVITTAWGGQTDFCNPGNSWLVDYKFERAETHFGLWSSAWAKVDTRSLSEALLSAFATSPEQRTLMAARGRSQLLDDHKWADVVERLSSAAATLPGLNDKKAPRIGWISTWNDKCGIATYSEHLISSMNADVTIFSPKNTEPLHPNDTSVKTWNRAKRGSDLAAILRHPQGSLADIFVINFNNTFYDHRDLHDFVKQCKILNKKVLLILHSTVDQEVTVPYEDYHLSYMVPTLHMFDRILVHSIDDLNRLKSLGIVDNVALFPHGVLSWSDDTIRSESTFPSIATYGFALPHKGLPQLLEAVRILNERGRPVRWKMVNAQHPAPVSADLLKEIRERATETGILHLIEMHNEFLSDDESMALVSSADLIVFPYQDTAESASGAVRYGMAAKRPVAVTPLAIFKDLDDAAFVFFGPSPEDLAEGLERFLLSVKTQDDAWKHINSRAAEWRRQHDYSAIGKRLANMCKALTIH